MITKAEIRKRIKDKRNLLSDKDVFTSPAFTELCKSYLVSVCHKLNRMPGINLIHINNNSTAWTNGFNVTVNTLSPLVSSLDTQDKKYISVVGYITHEAGHILFTDFPSYNQLVSKWTCFNQYVYNENYSDEERNIIEYFFSHPNKCKIFKKFSSDLINIIEDKYIEYKLYQYFSGICAAGLTLTRKQVAKLQTPIDVIVKKIAQKEMPLVIGLEYMVMLNRLDLPINVNINGLSSKEQSVYKTLKNVFDKIFDDLQLAGVENNGTMRMQYINKIIVESFVLFKNDRSIIEIPEECNQNNQSETNDESNKGCQKDNNSSCKDDNEENNEKESSDEIDNLDNNYNDDEESDDYTDAQTNSYLDEIGKDEYLPESPIGTTESVCNTDKSDVSKENKELSEDLVNDEDKLSRMTEIIKNSVSENLVNDEIKIEIEKELNKENKNRANINLYSNYKGKYNLSNDVIQISKKLINIFNRVFDNKQEDALCERKYYGGKFNAINVYKNDMKYFDRQYDPQTKPDIVFGVLIDQSGSMRGKKIETATKVAKIFDQVFSQLNIPYLMVGHNYTYECCLDVYKDFNVDLTPDLDLLVTNTNYTNCDGSAIKYMHERMIKQPEDIKVLLIISDGQSTEGVKGKSPMKHLIDEVDKAKKDNIHVITTFLDNDPNSFRVLCDAYGEKNILDCSDLNKVPMVFSRIIKKYLLQSFN